MTNVTPLPPPVSVAPSDVVVLPCALQMDFDMSPIARLFAEREMHEAENIVCRMLEDIALRLDMLQSGMAEQAFATMHRPAQRIGVIADQIGLLEVATAAGHVRTCLSQNDGIALEATVARLERSFDVAVSEVWNFRKL